MTTPENDARPVLINPGPLLLRTQVGTTALVVLAIALVVLTDIPVVLVLVGLFLLSGLVALSALVAIRRGRRAP